MFEVIVHLKFFLENQHFLITYLHTTDEIGVLKLAKEMMLTFYAMNLSLYLHSILKGITI